MMFLDTKESSTFEVLFTLAFVFFLCTVIGAKRHNLHEAGALIVFSIVHFALLYAAVTLVR